MNDAGVTVPKRSCSRCKEPLELTSDNFYRCEKSRDGFQTYCRGCANAIRARNRRLEGEGGVSSASLGRPGGKREHALTPARRQRLCHGVTGCYGQAHRRPSTGCPACGGAYVPLRRLSAVEVARDMRAPSREVVF
jgi:hypothetical protein